jgi:RNA polymerase sigma-70 factor (ECF subfamily)
MNRVDLEKEFIGILRDYERVIYKVCTFYVSDESPMADLYQDVVLNLWKGFAKFRNECALSTWVYRVTLNTCISGFRKEIRRAAKVPISFLLEETLPEYENTEIEENINEMYRLINQLKTLEKAIILLYLEDKSYQEIADITGLTVSNVATKLKRVKTKLKEMSNN